MKPTRGTQPRNSRTLSRRVAAALAAAALLTLPVATVAEGDNPAGIHWVGIGRFGIASTETTVGQFRRFVQATGTVTQAERNGGGEVYEAGWVRKPGWTWTTPFGGGREAADDEPAVHLTFGEALAFCRWAGGRLPSDAEWLGAAYREQRATPPARFQRGKTYAFPSGDSPEGAQCLADCGPQARRRAVPHGAVLTRGDGHALTGRTPPGVNGLFDMGGNAWEWVDDPPGATGSTERRTRGGSWWYGAAQMRADHLQSKPPDTAVVYLGMRCARER